MTWPRTVRVFVWGLLAPWCLMPQRASIAKQVRPDAAMLAADRDIKRITEACFRRPAAQAAEACQRLAAAVQGQDQVSPEVATRVYARLSEVLLELGRYSEAQRPARQALAGIEKWKGATKLEVAVVCDLLANALRHSGQLEEPEPLYRRALAIREAVFGSQHPEVAASLNNIALLFQARGKLDEAEPIFRRALAIVESSLGPHHPRVASPLGNLALLLEARGKLKEAEPLFRRALAMDEFALGSQHPDVATSLNNLALLLASCGKLKEAEPLARRALGIVRSAMGKQHPHYAASLENLGTLLKDRGKFQEAELLLRRALAIRQSVLGAQHSDVSTSLNSLGVLLMARGKLEEAELLFRRALTNVESALGSQHPDFANALNSLGVLLMARGKLEEAEPQFRRALGIVESSLGAQHPDFATCLDNLARLLQQRGKPEEAEPQFRRALAIRESALGSQHPGVAASLNNLASMLMERGKLEEAESLYRRALAVLESALGAQHPDVAATVNNLGSMLNARGRFQEAEPLFRRALAIVESALGARHPHIARSLSNLAGLLHAHGKSDVAKPLYRRALAIFESALGAQHQDVADCLVNLAALSLNQAKLDNAIEYLRDAAIIREAVLRASPSEAYAQGLLQLWQDEQMAIFGLPLLLPQAPTALDLALRAALLNKSRTQDVGALVNQTLHSALKTGAQRDQYARMQQLLAERAQLLNRPGGAEKRKQEQRLLWEAQQLNQALSHELGVSSTRSLPGFDGIREAVAAVLPADAALVEVVAGETCDYQARTAAERRVSISQHYVALVLYGSGQAEAIELGTADDVHNAMVPLLSGLRAPSPAIEAKAQTAYRMVFVKLDASLRRRGIRQLIVSPEMALHLLPWGTLHDGTQYLVDRYAIRYVAAGRDLLRKPSPAPPGQAVVLAAPLAPGQPPLVDAQAASLELGQKMSARLLLGAEATEERLGHTPAPFTLLLAAHGSYRAAPSHGEAAVQLAQADGPLLGLRRLGPLGARSLVPLQEPTPDWFNTEEAMHRSALALTPGRNPQDPRQDGLLTAEEVLALPLLGTQLVTMLACEGGMGALGLGQGVYGLRRAFLQAGAETVVSTLWSVEEKSASKLIGLYYDKLLREKKGRVQALDEAMKELRREPQYSHPYYWAPFVVLGMDGPLRHPAGVPVAGR